MAQALLHNGIGQR